MLRLLRLVPSSQTIFPVSLRRKLAIPFITQKYHTSVNLQKQPHNQTAILSEQDPLLRRPDLPQKKKKPRTISKRKVPERYHETMPPNWWGQKVTKKEGKQYVKAKNLGDLILMRSILRIPYGKVLKGYEELGTGEMFKNATENYEGRALFKKEMREYNEARRRLNIQKMRKVLKIPMGVVMEGHEDLGDGIYIPKKEKIKRRLMVETFGEDTPLPEKKTFEVKKPNSNEQSDDKPQPEATMLGTETSASIGAGINETSDGKASEKNSPESEEQNNLKSQYVDVK